MYTLKSRKLRLSRPSIGYILSNPGSWDVLDHGWDDAVGWSNNAGGTYSSLVSGGLLQVTAGDNVVDSDYITKYKTGLSITAGNDYTFQTRLKIISGLTTFSSDSHMAEVIVVYGGTYYTWIGVYTDLVRFRTSSGVSTLGTFSPILVYNTFYTFRFLFRQSAGGTWKYKAYISRDDGSRWDLIGSTSDTYSSSTSGQFEQGVFESNGGGSLEIHYDYIKITSGLYE